MKSGLVGGFKVKRSIMKVGIADVETANRGIWGA